MNEESIFNAALGYADPIKRCEYLDSACSGDPGLRVRVEALLRAHGQSGSFLDPPFDAVAHATGSFFTRNGLHDTLSLSEAPGVLLRDTDPGVEPPLVRVGSSEIPPVGDRSDRLQLFGEIARGGMGAVLKGRDTDLGRDLAIKVLLESKRDNPDMVRRFVEEAQIAGQLQHPGVVPVYELGAFADRRPYFSMKLVKGQTLAYLFLQRPAEPTDLPRFLTIFEQICQTIAYAHARGVIHRDLKPSNIMVGSFGEVQVMDWGLAKVLDSGGIADEERSAKRAEGESVIQTARSGSDADASRAGSVMGTPAYMPPEQARGEIDNLDERADVFGLGAILCEILTGSPPFVGATSSEILRKAARADLGDTMDRLAVCGAEVELLTLARRCLAAEPRGRPRDAGEVSAAFTTYLSGVQERLRETELARAEASARADEAGKRVQVERDRRRLQLGLAAALLIAITIGGLGTTYLLQQRQARLARVALALKEATLLRDQARAKAEESPGWLAALEGLKRVELALGEAAEPAARAALGGLRNEVQAGLAAAEADRKLLEHLDEIRGARIDDTDGSITDFAYADAFRSAGMDLDVLDPKEAAVRIGRRPESAAKALVAAIDHWTSTRKERNTKSSDWRRLVAVARAADPNAERDVLRAALLIESKADRLKQLRPLAEKADAAVWAPASLVLLGNALAEAGDVAAGVGVLRRATGFHPGDVWVQQTLGSLFERLRPPQFQEAIRAYTAARAIKPEMAHELAHALEKDRQSEETESVFRDLIRRQPKNVSHLGCFGVFLRKKGKSAEAKEVFARSISAGREAIAREPGNSEPHSRLAYALFLQRMYKESAVELREVIRLEPTLVWGHSNLGIVLAELGKNVEAEAECREAIRLEPDRLAVYVNLSTALINQGKFIEAAAASREAVRLDPNDALAHGSLGNALGDQGKHTEAIAELREAILLKPDLVDCHYGLARVLKAAGKLDEAIAETREAIRLDPNDPDARVLLGGIFFDQGKTAEASAEFRAAIGLDPRNANAHLDLGHILLEQGKVQEAIAETRAAIKLNPRNVVAHNNLGACLIKFGKTEDAIAKFREAISLDPNNADAHRNLGTALSITGSFAEAAHEFREVLRLKPDDAYSRNNLGRALSAQGKHDEAATEYRDAIRLDPKSHQAHNNLGALLCGQKRFSEAEAEFREAVQIKPDDGATRFNLGNALLGQGKLDPALTEYHEAVRLSPEIPQPHQTLVALSMARGAFADAAAECREVIRLLPNDAASHANLGFALDGLGKSEEAFAAWNQAIKLNPNLPNVQFWLGKAYLRDGKTTQAIEHLHRVLDLSPEGDAMREDALRQLSVAERSAELPAILRGETKVKDASEAMAFGQICYDKGLHAAAVRLWGEAITLDSKLAEDRKTQPRYNAACAAALAGCGMSKDDPAPDDTAKIKLRRQALEWLQAEIKAWSAVVDEGPAHMRAIIVPTLQHWKEDGDLAGIRDPDALAKLPEDERKEWQALWAKLDLLVAKAKETR